MMVNWTPSSSAEVKVKGCSGAGLGESIAWGMEIYGEVVGKETCVWEEETEICGAAGETGCVVCVLEKENVFSLVEKRLCVVSGERACGYASF